MKNEKIKAIEKGISDLQEKLRELQEPELEINKWYKDNNSVFYLYKISGKAAFFYGFINSVWTYKDWYSTIHLLGNCEPATNEEVEAALIKEAKNRGFKEGITVKQVGDSFKGAYKIESNKYWLDPYTKLFSGSAIIFNKGKWAEIIGNKVTINNYEMEQDGGIISFGCAKFHKNWFQDLSRFCFTDKLTTPTYNWKIENRRIKSITLDSGVEITIEELKLICDNIK